jgi:hypothetical protein
MNVKAILEARSLVGLVSDFIKPIVVFNGRFLVLLAHP